MRAWELLVHDMELREKGLKANDIKQADTAKVPKVKKPKRIKPIEPEKAFVLKANT